MDKKYSLPHRLSFEAARASNNGRSERRGAFWVQFGETSCCAEQQASADVEAISPPVVLLKTARLTDIARFTMLPAILNGGNKQAPKPCLLVSILLRWKPHPKAGICRTVNCMVANHKLLIKKQKVLSTIS